MHPVFPTFAPSLGPTRYPTADEYNAYFRMTYVMSNASENYIDYMAEDFDIRMTEITTIIERGYVDIANIEYKTFWVRILTVNEQRIDDLGVRKK